MFFSIISLIVSLRFVCIFIIYLCICLNQNVDQLEEILTHLVGRTIAHKSISVINDRKIEAKRIPAFIIFIILSLLPLRLSTFSSHLYLYIEIYSISLII